MVGDRSQTGTEPRNSKDKHLIIDDSLDTIDSALNKLENFVDKVNGTVSTDQPTTEKATPSLSEVLCSTPDRIIKHSVRIHDAISRLTEMLF